NYLSATGRFDLYILFFEQALSVMNNGGRLVFITPEKFLYVETTAVLRGLLSRVAVEELVFLDEQSFGDLVTYPLITTLSAKPPGETIVRYRDGATRRVQLAGKASSWLPTVLGAASTRSGSTLSDICSRISCGVATGADSVFVLPTLEVPGELLRFAYPTISGREIVTSGSLPPVCKSMLVPYNADGTLIPEEQLGALREFLSSPARKQKLLRRTCVERKPWYAFHENPPLRGVLRPKLLCKDIGAAPTFVIDREGTILPRHSVYYIVPRSAELLDPLAEYLNSKPAQQWLLANCQRAANGFIRVQSHVLKQMPLPPSLAVNPADNARSVSRLSA
ncbi:MAG: DNA methyltransferase, partial [Gemmatimonadota bacterium]|nr:DNA methyltransferase [Gemmatimonadota bacterium]